MAARQPLSLFALIAAAVLSHAIALPAHSEAPGSCGPLPPPGGVYPGAYGAVGALTNWDPDGPGPAPARLVIAGSFSFVGNTPATGVASWDGTSWTPLGKGFSLEGYPSAVSALLALRNGDLLAGGDFVYSGTTKVSGIARWNGVEWLPLGDGLSGVAVTSLAQLPNGDLVAAGSIKNAIGYPVEGIARKWNGSQWTSLSGGLGSQVTSLVVRADGTLLASTVTRDSQFTIVGSSIRQWNGASWAPFGTGSAVDAVPGHLINVLSILPNGDLVAAGYFSSIDGVRASSIARWNGASWMPVGAGVPGYVYSATALSGNRLVAAGSIVTSAGGKLGNAVMLWDGSAWAPIGLNTFGGPYYASTALPNGDLAVGGGFAGVGGVAARGIARWNGTTWSSFSSGTSGQVRALAIRANGDVVAAGGFESIGGVQAGQIALQTGAGWRNIGDLEPQYDKASGTTLAIAPNGDIIVAGSFKAVSGVSALGLARWNGVAWSAMGLTNSDMFYAPKIAAAPNGDIILGGDFSRVGGVAAQGVARWDGTRWSRMGASTGPLAYVSIAAIAVQPDGQVIAGGSFKSIDGVPANNIARWDGSHWSPLGTGSSSGVSALTLDASGGILAAGEFFTGGNPGPSSIARWDGSSWQPVGDWWTPDSIHTLAVLRGGEIVAGGDFSHITAAFGGDLIPADSLAYWDGTIWSAFAGGAAGLPANNYSRGEVLTLAAHPDGGFYAGGNFLTAGGVVSPYLARWPRPVSAKVLSQPSGASVCRGASASFTTAGEGGSKYLWEREDRYTPWQPISSNGGHASGFSTPVLALSNTVRADAGRYRCVVTNICGNRTATNPATLTVCIADFDCSGRVNTTDLFAFLSAWLAHDHQADINDSGRVNSQDLFDFLAAWFSRC